VVQFNEAYRWLAAPKATPALLARPLLYVTEPGSGEITAVTQDFAKMRLLATLTRQRNGRPISTYQVYLVSGWRGAAEGRITNRP
jgi:type IV secretory pathway ATPase VirB11/archaellum biosynthesis ATPase